MSATGEAAAESPIPAPPGGGGVGGGVARNTAIFSIATGISRIAGLLREIVAASFFGTRGPASAFTIAFQIPNLVSNLFANAALSAAFVPVFTDLLQQGRRKEAFRLASTLFWIMLIALGAVTAVFILAAGLIMPLFTGPAFNAQLDGLTAGLSQILFPVVLLLGLNGLLVGVLQSYDHFTIPAISPAVWNVVILLLLIVLHPHFHGGYENGDQLYPYAIAILVATFVMLLMAFGALGRIDFRLQLTIDWHDPRVKQVFALMLPVTIGLGIVNLDQVINSVFGTLVSKEAPRAIDNAFRIYMLPQGMFSVAVATVLFPTLSRMAARRDAAANAVMTVLQLRRLRVGFNGRLEGGQTTMITARIVLASALLAGVSWVAWKLLDALLGVSLPGQIVSVGGAAAAGLFVYIRAVLAMHVPEAHQVSRLIRTQLGRV